MMKKSQRADSRHRKSGASGSRASRPRLSQHFLRDSRAAARIVSYASLSASDRVLEIGPGRGALTRHLLDTGAKVYAIEADKAMAGELLRTLVRDNLSVMITDATEAPWPEVDKIVSNLPYHITTPLVLRVLDAPVKLSVLTVQKEYADRMAAEAGEDAYSRLSVAVACRAECVVLETLPPGAFDPPPKVHSSVVRLTPHPFPFPVKSESLYFEVVRTLFSQRRKKVGTVMRSTAGLKEVPHRDNRPEELTPKQLGEIADAVFDDVSEEAGRETARGAKKTRHKDEEDECTETCNCL